MTLKELYANIGGNYDQAVKVMRSEKLIDRYVRKLKDSGVDKSLAQAKEAMDGQMIFESAHGLKGLAGNLGLINLADAANEITEEFRPGNPRNMSDEEVQAKIDDILTMYNTAVEGIRQYEEA